MTIMSVCVVAMDNTLIFGYLHYKNTNTFSYMQ